MKLRRCGVPMRASKLRRRHLPAIAAIDFEASSLPQPGSFPIEVAVAYAATGDTRSWLVKPAPAWIAAGLWDPSSERIHGISRATVEREGRPAEKVARELAAAVAGHIVVTDSIAGDGFWLARLYAASGRRPFRLEPHIAVIETFSTVKGTALSSELREADEIASRRFPARHRALPDARRLVEIVRIVLDIP
jgi:DNA polymerase III epsilon subunit-like protein